MPGPGRQGHATGKKAVAQIVNTEKTAEMLVMRRNGLTYQQIADHYGLNITSVYERVKRALHNTIAEPAESVRQMELDRLDHLYHKLAHKIEAGDTRAIQTALSIMDRRAKMLGIDSPLKVESSVTLNETNTIDRSVAELVALHKAMMVNDDTTPAER